ncbi:hypothetical protein [Limosilactobacillus reuteri]|uniref:hypothetical protein n=1 Tax=Limosilactobacillus reuteri TaxID=1598 RepID=UPI001E3CC0A1|nr:hypothetical protein [Limosilactobacillus reuteri]MCC4485845.1 hypothetical protein [Limosilactobacillus reuteri]
MGFFGQSESKLDKELDSIDKKLIYKKSLVALEKQAQENFSSLDSSALAAIVLHHDLQEIKKVIENK